MTYTACITCKEPFSKANVFTVEGYMECDISGMCEICFDRLFEDAWDEDYEEED